MRDIDPAQCNDREERLFQWDSEPPDVPRCGDCGEVIDGNNCVDIEAIKGVVPRWVEDYCAECASAIADGSYEDYQDHLMQEKRESRR